MNEESVQSDHEPTHVEHGTHRRRCRWPARKIVRSALILAVLGGVLGFAVPSVPDATATEAGGGGHPASAPWQVSIHSPEGHICDASIVGPNVVLTSASCTTGRTSGEITVRSKELFSEELQVSRLIEHPPGNPDDLALVVLDESVHFSAEQIVPIPTEQEYGAGIRLDAPMTSHLYAAEGSCHAGEGLVAVGADGSPTLTGVLNWGDNCLVPRSTTWTSAFAGWLREEIDALTNLDRAVDESPSNACGAPDVGAVGEG